MEKVLRTRLCFLICCMVFLSFSASAQADVFTYTQPDIISSVPAQASTAAPAYAQTGILNPAPTKASGSTPVASTSTPASVASTLPEGLAAIESSDREIWGALGGHFLNYKEEVPPPSLSDSERGWMYSMAGGLSVLFNNPTGLGNNIYFAFEAAGTFGTTHYRGALLATPTVPYNSTTNDTIGNFDARFGKGFPVSSFAMITPYMEFGYRYWARALEQKEEEDYHNLDSLAGVMVQVSPLPHLVLTGYGSAGTTLASGMTFDTDHYDLGNSFMYKVGGKIGYMISNIELFATLENDHFRYGQSPVLPDSSYEPTSNTDETTMRVGIGYSF